MHDDVDAVVVDAEQQVRLDELETLVHQRRRVQRVHRAHRPGRVGAGLLRGDVLEVGGRPAAERSARRGQHHLGDLVGAPGPQALRERGVLGVDGHDLTGLGGLQHQRAAGDQRLLVRQRQPGAGFQRGQRGLQTERTDQRVEHDVGLGVLAPARVAASAPDVGDVPIGSAAARVGDRDVGDAGLGRAARRAGRDCRRLRPARRPRSGRGWRR